MENQSLYRTARLATDVFTHNGEHDLREGDVVGVAYRCTARNQLYRRDMAVYSVTKDGEFWGDLYESALKDFAL